MRRHLRDDLQAGPLRAGRTRWSAIACMLLPCLAGAQAPPAKKDEKPRPPVSLRIAQQGERSYALTRLDITIEWRLPRPAAGRLVLGVHDGMRRLLEVRSRELSLAPGSNRFPVHLPPLRGGEGGPYLTLLPELVTDAGTFRLDAQLVSVPPTDQRRLLIATVAAELGESRDRCDRLQPGLKLERGLETENPEAVQTRFLAVRPAELPSSPLELCRFDAVLLHEEGFLELEEGQLAGLATWVEGGGALWIVPGTGLKERHLAFLGRLAASGGEAARFALEGGAVTWGGPARAGPLRLTPGVGRAVAQLAPVAAATDLESPSWEAARRFLWGSSQDVVSLSDVPALWAFDLNVVPPLTELLLPPSVQLVPFAALAGILAAFLLVIGPADYFLLGALRRRRLTWLTFPAASAAATLLVTLLSQHYLGARSHQAALVLVDVGEGNRPVRVNRFELRFPAAPRQIELAAEKAFVMPLGGAEFPGGVASIEGPYPARHAFQQSLRQWQSVLHRTFGFEAAPDEPALGWAEIDAPARAWFERAGATEPAFLEALLGTSQLAGVEVFLIHRKMCIRWSPGGAWHQLDLSEPSSALLDALVRLSLVPVSAWNGRVARASPTGEENLEDVPLLDSGDRTQSLIIVTCRRGDDIVCWRRLYQRRD